MEEVNTLPIMEFIKNFRSNWKSTFFEYPTQDTENMMLMYS
jgi:hypothetical protein